jgi:hypothetical protein
MAQCGMVDGEKHAIAGAIGKIEGGDCLIYGAVITARCVAQNAAHGIGSVMLRLQSR